MKDLELNTFDAFSSYLCRTSSQNTMHKRQFIKTLATAGLAIPFTNTMIAQLFSQAEQNSGTDIVSDDTYWQTIRESYLLKPEYINLENGYYCMIPESTLEQLITETREVNLHASHYMRTRMMDDKIATRKAMAEFLGCKTEEVVITRNATESLDLIISGIDWKPGDEAIMAEQDYPAMLDMFKQQSERYKMRNVMISIPMNPKSDDEIVSLYEQAITPRTKLIMMCHMINITGQILPVQKVCDMAHKRGIKVLVDGAHAVGHFQFKIDDLHCDYYGSSLHKWLSVPLGAGLLYVKEENIAGIWPLLGDSGYEKTDIRKLGHTGTQPMHIERTLPYAIEFHNGIGGERKEARLRYLQQYWTKKVRDQDRIILNTPEDSRRSCAIANVGIESISPAELSERLMNEYGIWTVAIDFAGVKGCRITPNVFTLTHELDTLVKALMDISKS